MAHTIKQVWLRREPLNVGRSIWVGCPIRIEWKCLPMDVWHYGGYAEHKREHISWFKYGVFNVAGEKDGKIYDYKN